jgi:PAS domain S-box-containing protein
MDNRPDVLKRITALLRLHRSGLTITDISHKLKLNRNSVAKYLEILLISGDVNLNTFGPAKVYTISRKMPLSAVLKFSADIIILIGEDMRVLDANENALAVLGVPRSDLVGNRIDDLNSPLITRLAIPEAFHNIQETGEIQREFALSREGEDRHYRVRLVPTVFDTREEGITIIGEDITEQIRFEERLMVSEARFRAIVEDQTEFICRWRPEGRITFINEALSRYIGISCSEAAGQSIFAYISPDEHTLVTGKISSFRNDREVISLELKVKDKNHHYRWHQWNTRGIYDNSGTLVECQSVGRDITDLKQSEAALRRSELLYRTILDNIQDVYYRCDLDGNLTMASPSAPALVGYENLDEILGKNIARSFYQNPESRLQLLEKIHHYEKVTDYEIMLKKKDGSPVVVSTNSQLVRDNEGAVVGIEGFFRDITPRKKAEQALRESEERYRNVVEDQTEFICRFKPDGTLTFVNDAYCRYFGLDRNTCLGKHHNVLLAPEDEQQMKQHLSMLTPDHSTGIIEHRVSLPDRRVRWHIWTDRARFDTDGHIIEYQSVGRDTTEIKEQAERIQKSEERFRRITDLSPFPISIIGRDGTYRYLNRRFQEIFGYSLEDIPNGHDWFNRAFPDPALREEALATWKQETHPPERGTIRPRVYPVTCRDGSVRQIHFFPIMLDDGEQFIVYEDLTHKAESERLRSVLASIVNSSGDAIIGKSLDGTILSWNKAAERYYGYLAEEVIGKSIELIIPQNLRNQCQLLMRRAGSGETIDRFETYRVRKDGSRVDVAVTLSPIRDEDGLIVGISTIAENLAERKKADADRSFRHQVLHRR